MGNKNKPKNTKRATQKRQRNHAMMIRQKKKDITLIPPIQSIITEPTSDNASNIFLADNERVESPLTYLNLDEQTNSSTLDSLGPDTQESHCTNTIIDAKGDDAIGIEITEVETKIKLSQPKTNIDEEKDLFKKNKSHARKRKYDKEKLSKTTEIDNCDVEHGINVSGHRIVDLKEFIMELQKISTHESLFDCDLNSLNIVSEKRTGLHSEFKLSCQMCKKTFTLKNSSDDLNKNVVSGVMAAGCGNSELTQFIAALNLPTISAHTFNKVQDQVCNEWELTAWDEMKKAGEKEREAAIREGRVDKDGIPLIDVVLDGCWSKRSYRTNYSASSGAAAIIGRRFGEVLFMSVKNKYCCVCARAERKKEENVKNHTCYKNYSGPSTAMEAAIIVEGFKQSIEMHQVIYSRFIADGDSNTYAKILESRPYPNITVEKINCRNHILRNFCNKLQQLKTDTKYRVDERKAITNEKILSARKYIINSIKHHKTSTEIHTDKIKKLHKDISVCFKHGFGSHDNCNKDICTKETKPGNDNFFNSTLWQKIKFIATNVASHARSLIEDVDSNIVECFNSVIAKFVGGKRINYALRRSYQARCAGAVISFNTGKVLSTVRQNIYNEPASEQLLKHELKTQKKRDTNKKRLRKSRRCAQTNTKIDNNYGKNADAPDLDPISFEEKKDSFLKNLEKTEVQRKEIEAKTKLQSQCGEWMELRRNLLTASNFGKVIKRNVKNSCQNIIKHMIYKANIQHVASVAHGINNEERALDQLSILLDVTINKCGLYIDEHHPFLGATPDGIIVNEDVLVEIKCPIAASKIGIDAAIAEGKMHFWRVKKDTGEIYMNKKSDWYFQIQGQMRIAKKKKCVLAAWYGDFKIKTETIEKDDQFWNTIMEPKLVKFYFDCLLPELVDPRFTRNRPIRDPSYVVIKARKQNTKDKENAKQST